MMMCAGDRTLDQDGEEDETRLGAHRPPPDHVERSALGDAVEPRRRISRRLVCPGGHCPSAGFGKSILGDVEIAKPGRERGTHARAVIARGPVEHLVHYMPSSGRISTDPSA